MTFVLVHGAWHGGWCWQRVSDRLTAQGHRVFAPTMTGIDLTSQINEILNEIRSTKLEGVVLVGHSYGGMVITGVAEQFTGIASIVYVDAFIPADGQSTADLGGKADAGPLTTPLSAEQFAINLADRAWADRMMTPQSTACFTERLKVTGAYQAIARKTYIRAKGFPVPAFAVALEMARKDASWQTFEIECGHDIMIDKPDELASVLARCI